MVSEIPSDRPIAKNTVKNSASPSTTSATDTMRASASESLSRVQAEVSSSIKIPLSNTKTDGQLNQTPRPETHQTVPNKATQTTNQSVPVPPKALYDTTIVFNRQTQAQSTLPVATQLTPAVMQQINQGLTTIVRITTDLSLAPGDKLIVDSSTQQNPARPDTPLAAKSGNASQGAQHTSSTAAITHLVLKQLQPIPTTERVQQTITNLVRLLVPNQNSYSPLLNNILNLTSNKPELLKQLPLSIQQAIKSIATQLPVAKSLHSAENVKQAIKQSGVFLESSLKHQAPGLDTARLNTQRTGTSQNNSLIGSNKDSQTKPNIDGTLPRFDNAKITSSISDFKHQLLSLEKSLLSKASSSSANNSTTSSSTTSSSNSSTIKAPGVAPATSSTPTASPATGNLTGKQPALPSADIPVISEKQQLQNLAQLAKTQHLANEIKHSTNQERVVTPPEQNATRPTTSSTPKGDQQSTFGAIKAYQSPPLTAPPSLQGVPPLPGQFLMQAQSNIKTSLKGDEVADALVKILLKQTQESISRLQLHQLSTAAAHTDDGAQIVQAPISFDLPILHFGQLTLFHFHIEEETNPSDEKKDASADKKWSVSMGFNIEGLGAMFCELNLINTQVYVKFWAKEKDTVTRAKSYFDVLQDNLNKIGATVKELECIEGLPPQQETGIQASLIDIET